MWRRDRLQWALVTLFRQRHEQAFTDSSHAGKMNMAVFGYFAFSAAELEFSAAELKKRESAQQRAIKRSCEKQGWEPEEIFRDLGGKWQLSFERRREAKRLLARLRRGDVIVCQSPERMFGSVSEVSELLKLLRRRRIRLFVGLLDSEITGDECVLPLGRLLESLALIETRRGAERIRGIKARQREKGRYLGGNRPFGYMVHQSGRLIENPMEQNMIRRIVFLRGLGWSLRAIAEKVSLPATPISFKTVQRVLRREAEN